MYWKATLAELPGMPPVDIPVQRIYYGYIDEKVYPEWDTEVANEIFLYLEEQLAPETEEGPRDYSKLAILECMNIDVETITREEYYLKTAEV